MEKEELLEIANVVSSVFLLDQHVSKEEIVSRLKTLARIIRKNITKEQQSSLKAWIVNIFSKRLQEKKVIEEFLDDTKMEVEEVVSNLDKLIDKEIKKGRNMGRLEGKKEGRLEGIKEAVYDTAKNLLKLGADINLIKKATNLTDEEIENIKNDIEKEKN